VPAGAAHRLRGQHRRHGARGTSRSPSAGAKYVSPRAALERWKNIKHLGTGIDSKRLRAGGRTKRSGNTSLQIMYGAPGVTGTPLLEGVMLRKFFKTEGAAKYTVGDVVKAKLLTPVEIEGADGAYLFHNEAKGLSFGWIAANVGPYVVVFNASTTKDLEFHSREVNRAGRLAAVAAIVANIKKASRDG
jgi:hypothetical protein